MSTVTKRDIVTELSDLTGLKHQQVADVLDKVIDLISQKMENGQEVTFRKFGTFEVRVAKSKIGRNPNKPKDEVLIPDRCIVRFKPGRELKERVLKLDPKVIQSNGNSSAEK
ncbi:integration host factor subunit alpha [Prosthecobacter debontii]|uniref:Integration host factor subunit alpha n=1 Tax=Prosthecobacter debontii TaxID=48467 RepID=A0A1T4YUB7_9BACT|nr:HU family DNA-binding protein [Prosthecobacter debontii]SKB05316.1 integration host factor subunit alpha [Prosthecobacter debontii]